MSFESLFSPWLLWFLLGLGFALLELIMPGLILIFFRHRQPGHRRHAAALGAGSHLADRDFSDLLPRLAGFAAALDDAGFREVFSGSPIKRIGRNRFVRNVLYAIGNSGEAGLRDYVRPLLGDEDPVVRDAAEWAMKRLPRQ